MSKYASLLFGPEKYYEIGPFRFPVYEDLVPGEAKYVEEYSKKQSKATFKSLKLAQRIAKDKDISTKEAVALMSEIGKSEDSDLVYEYADEIEDLQSQGVNATEQKIEFVTLFMRFRGEAMISNNEWTALKDWDRADTEGMPTKLMDQVFQMMMWERDGWPAHEDVEGNAEMAKKSSPQKKSSTNASST